MATTVATLSPRGTTTAIVVDDHPMCRQATAMALRLVDPEIRVVEATTLSEARDAAADGAGLMTLDLALPDNRSVLGLPALIAEFPAMKLLVITGAMHPGTEAQVRGAGAHGYLSKAASMDEMTRAMRTVLTGGTWFGPAADEMVDADDFGRLAQLTPAQMRVLTAMEGGRLNKQIAFDLGLSEITVKAHVKAILKKLSVVNRTQAVLMLRRAHA